MSKKRLTCLIIAQDSGRMRKLTVPHVFLWLFTAVILVGVAGATLFSHRYVAAKRQLGQIGQLRQLACDQEQKIEHLLSRSRTLEKRITELNILDKKIRMLANLEDPSKENQFLGIGGPLPDDNSCESNDTQNKTLVRMIQKNMDNLLKEATRQESSFQELLMFLNRQQSVLASTPSIWPVMGIVTSEFGYRRSPFTGNREFHAGLDIATRIGKEIVAPAAGVVVEVSPNPHRGIGHTLRIDHQNGVITTYGHLLKYIVKMGQKVSRGDVIAFVGNSGRSTGPHLHYAIMVNGVYVNPRRYLF